MDALETFSVLRLKKNWFNLWRLRKFHHLIKDISECWEPPAANATMGRCNAKGSPVLYVSEQPRTPFEELVIQPDEQVYLIMYKQIERLNLKQIVSKKFFLTDENEKPLYDGDRMLSYQILREFVRSEFLKPVGKGTEYLHRISGSMCRVWFDDRNSDGWVYPSVQSPKDFNIAIKPESAHQKLKIEDVRIVQMVNREEVIKSGRIKDSALPWVDSMKLVVESIFKGAVFTRITRKDFLSKDYANVIDQKYLLFKDDLDHLQKNVNPSLRDKLRDMIPSDFQFPVLREDDVEKIRIIISREKCHSENESSMYSIAEPRVEYGVQSSSKAHIEAPLPPSL